MAVSELPADRCRPQSSGNILFGRLAVDMVHYIFHIVLELDRIHDYDVPFEVLDELRKTVFCLRCVSALWNQFILSSPQYWCVINVRGLQAAMVMTIERAQAAPLCIYSVRPSHWQVVHFDQIKPMLVARHGQIQTLRLNDKDLYDFGLSLIRPGLPALRTLEMVPRSYPYRDERPPIYDTPQLRHLTSKSWRPPLDANWISGLKTLVLRELDGFDPDLYYVLELCAYGLRKLSLGLGSAWKELSRTPEAIFIPHLEELRLDIGDRRTTKEIMQRILIPQSAGGKIRVSLQLEDGTVIRDLLDFLLRSERGVVDREPVNIEIDSELGLMYAKYTNGNRSLQFGFLYGDMEADYEAIRNIFHDVHVRLGHPVISVNMTCDFRSDAEVLKAFYSSTVQVISIITRSLEGIVDLVATAFGRPDPDLPGQTVDDEGSWPFQSLQCFAIDCHHRDVDISKIISIIEQRQDYMKACGMIRLERIVLARSCLVGMSFSDAAAKLGALGITLSEEEINVHLQLWEDIL
ncbi:hypothetical protein M407DRAFT_19427 [Tulasnella calospora MUT 4182]|uniref:F-box domain-containing protein n=1 Tax=Tulasnella calospora MUT 4182 TaxID=1051891 RepID=A0A0C3QTS6_9AGAM|nr:hypothetical protein M407DRAFT_19427 [Tulasnella calospora MUT 4182]